jgi:macrolide-specific efflux system membrane fusion protein
MKKTVAVLALLFAAWGLWKWKSAGKDEGATGWMRSRVIRGDLVLGVQATGNVQPQNRVALRPPVSGRVEQVLVREGDWVKRGDILAWMSSSDRAALLDAARAKGPAELKHWEDLYKATPLIAPITGTIIARNVEPGQTVGSGDSPLVVSDRLIVKAQVDETDVAKVKLGQAARLTLDAYPDKPIAATVDHLAYEARNVNNVTIYDVEVLPKQVPSFMRSGMSVGVQFETDARRGALIVPADAVVSEGGRSFVYVEASPTAQAAAVAPEKEEKRERHKRDWGSFSEEQKAAWKAKRAERQGGEEGTRMPPMESVGAAQALSKAVEVGLSDGARTEILSGLQEGEAVLIRSVALPTAAATNNPFAPARPGAGQRAPRAAR